MADPDGKETAVRGGRQPAGGGMDGRGVGDAGSGQRTAAGAGEADGFIPSLKKF